MRRVQEGADGNVPADSLQFIDFEYGCSSYRGFDWGNHFNEYAGFECEYGRYPDRDSAAAFIRAYLAEAHHGREPVRQPWRAPTVLCCGATGSGTALSASGCLCEPPKSGTVMHRSTSVGLAHLGSCPAL